MSLKHHHALSAIKPLRKHSIFDPVEIKDDLYAGVTNDQKTSLGVIKNRGQHPTELKKLTLPTINRNRS